MQVILRRRVFIIAGLAASRCLQYHFQKLQYYNERECCAMRTENSPSRRLWSEAPAVDEDADDARRLSARPILLLLPILWIGRAPLGCVQAMRRLQVKRERETCSLYNDKAESKRDTRKLGSLACWQAAATALTNAQHHWLQLCPRQHYLWNVPTDPGCPAKKVMKKLLEQEAVVASRASSSLDA